VGTLAGHESAVTSLAFRPDGVRIVTGADEGARLWDAATFQTLRALPHTSAVIAVAFAHDGKSFATATDDGISLFDEDGASVRTMVLPSAATCLAFAPDGRLAAGTRDGTVCLLDAKDGRVLATLTGHTDPLTAIRFTRAAPRLRGQSLDHHELDPGRDAEQARLRVRQQGRMLAAPHAYRICIQREQARAARGQAITQILGQHQPPVLQHHRGARGSSSAEQFVRIAFCRALLRPQSGRSHHHRAAGPRQHHTPADAWR
jgi:hypothetical protein